MAFLDNSGVTALVTRLKNYFALKTDIPTVPTAYTSNPAMDGIASAGSGTTYARGNHVHPHDTSRVPTSTTINGKALSSNVTLSASDVGAQATLVSGTNIKTINGESLLGSGDITVGGGGGGSASGLLVTITSNGNTHTANKTAQEIYNAVTAGIQPVINYYNNYYPVEHIYTNGSRLELFSPSAISGAVLVANSMSDYPSYSGGGGGGDN